MSPTQLPNDARWWALVEASCEGTASENQLREIEQLLIADERFRLLYAAHMDLVAQLRCYEIETEFHAEPLRDARAWVPLIEPGREASPSRSLIRQRRPATRRWRASGARRWLARAVGLAPARRRPAVAAVAAAVLLMAAILAIARWSGPSAAGPAEPPRYVAQLRGSRDAQWSQRGAPNPEGQLAAGRRLMLDKGLAEIEFGNGARVILQGPATLEPQSSSCALIARGVLTARVPPEAIGFTVGTPQADVVDLGTAFGVAVESKGRSEFEVFAGTVQVKPTAGSESEQPEHRLEGGEALRILAPGAGRTLQVNRVAAGGRQYMGSLTGAAVRPSVAAEPDVVDSCSVPEAAAELASPRHHPKGRLVYVDLQPQANRKLTAPAGKTAENDLRELPQGERRYAGVKFLVGASAIQLASTRLPEAPTEVTGISIQTCASNVYVLHAMQWGEDTHGIKEGAKIGAYRVRYADGSAATIPIVAGQDLRDWWGRDRGQRVSRGQVVWAGRNPATQRAKRYLRLYLTVWENPHPEQVMVSIDYVSMMTAAAPFCVALTVEEPLAAETSPEPPAQSP